MKKISFIYNRRASWPVVDYLKADLETIFGNYINTNIVFLDELSENEIIEGDLFLILYESMVYSLKKHVRNLDNIVSVIRGINKQFLSEILTLPDATDVLVVNDSYISTFQTTNILLELGIDNVNFIPYYEFLDKNDYYSNLEISLTANAEHLIPKNIKKIINIGFRQIGYSSLIKIVNKLNINDPEVYKKIQIRNTEVIEPYSIFGNSSNFLDNYLKSEMLDKVISTSDEGIIITDDKYNLIYLNNKATNIFNIYNNIYKTNIRDIIDSNIFDHIYNTKESDKFIKINDENYTLEIIPIQLYNLPVGYSFVFRAEKNIRDLEINLKNHFIKDGFFAKYSYKDIIYKSETMNQCILLSKQAALTDYTIFIKGESGTGKELLAQSIHNYSRRSNMPFVAINCAALPESLLQSELFGYESGSFTGANKNGKIGLFEKANQGTIFLDEIGDIPNSLQLQLLRVIQERQIMRIGSDKLINIDVRIIVATNKDLEKSLENGSFRGDLYYRLNVIPINIPPLRNRKEDILMLLKKFSDNKFNSISTKDKEMLIKYNWPGNVRELASISNYYNTLNQFPSHIYDEKNNEIALNSESLQTIVLKIIYSFTDIYHGMGRAPLLKELKIKGINISDSKLRDFLNNLKESDLIEINLGRGGNRITNKGINYLNKKL